MNTRKKVAISLVAVVLVVVAAVVAVAGVLAARSQAIGAKVTVEYHAYQVRATVSAKYAFASAYQARYDADGSTEDKDGLIGKGSADPSYYSDALGKLPNTASWGITDFEPDDGTNEISFDAGEDEAATHKSFKDVSGVKFEDAQNVADRHDVIIFTFTFENDDTVGGAQFTVSLENKDDIATALSGKNVEVYYATEDAVTTWSTTAPTMDVVPAATKEYYVRLHVTDADEDLSALEISFVWRMENSGLGTPDHT